MKRGDSTQVVIYPKLDVKAAIVRYVKSKGLRMSGFIQLAAIERIARESGKGVLDLVSRASYAEMQRVRGRSVDGLTKAKRPHKSHSENEGCLTEPATPMKYGWFSADGESAIQEYEGDEMQQEGEYVKIFRFGRTQSEPAKRQVATIRLDKNQSVREM
jgi:hypothetical protein